MRALRFSTMFLLIVFIVASSNISIAQQKSITLPEGKKVEKIGAGSFKSNIPDQQLYEVKGSNRTGSGKAKAIVGDCGKAKAVLGDCGKSKAIVGDSGIKEQSH